MVGRGTPGPAPGGWPVIVGDGLATAEMWRPAGRVRHDRRAAPARGRGPGANATLRGMTEPMTSRALAPDRFERPKLGWFLLIDSGLAEVAVLSVSDKAYEAVSAKVPLPPRSVVRAIAVGAAVVHVDEATFAYRSAKAAGMHASAGRWARQTLVVGFHSLLRLKAVRAG